MSRLEKYLPFIIASVIPFLTVFNFITAIGEVQLAQMAITYFQTGIVMLLIWYLNKWLLSVSISFLPRWIILGGSNLILISLLGYISVVNAPEELDGMINFWAVLFRLSLIVLVFNVILRVFESQKERSRLQMQNLALQSENLKFQVETLKQQINPHFLFNSLNTLLDLIEEDQEEAVDFTRKFSNLYRVVLQSIHYDYIPLSDELKFLDDYWSLLKMRFRDAILLEIDIEEDKKRAEIPPLSLQFLVENAVKHNEASPRKPLKISIVQSDDFLFVTNKLAIKSFPVKSEQIGLENLQKRFTLLHMPIEFGVKGSEFVVKLPLKTS